MLAGSGLARSYGRQRFAGWSVLERRWQTVSWKFYGILGRCRVEELRLMGRDTCETCNGQYAITHWTALT